MREPLESGWLTHGPKVAAFEKAFAARHGVPHAVAVTSATTGLHAGTGSVRRSDPATKSSFRHLPGFRRRIASCIAALRRSSRMSNGRRSIWISRTLRRRVTSRTKAIIAVHLFGLCARHGSRCARFFRLRSILSRMPLARRAGRLATAVPGPSAVSQCFHSILGNRSPPARAV